MFYMFSPVSHSLSIPTWPYIPLQKVKRPLNNEYDFESFEIQNINHCSSYLDILRMNSLSRPSIHYTNMPCQWG